jgi:hypothetical protein
MENVGRLSYLEKDGMEASSYSRRFISMPRPPGTAIYGNPAYIICMTRKDKMKEGFVARTFHIPMDLDEKLKIKAAKARMRFSEVTILALEEYLK